MGRDARKTNFKNITLPNDFDGPTLMELGLSLVHPFYNEEERFDIQFQNWKELDEQVKRKLQIVLVDDCSKTPVSDLITRSKQKRIDFNIEGYRVLEDLKWNTPGALNLGIIQAPTDWVLIMDSDCLFKPDMMNKLMSELRPDRKWSYWFTRDRITDDPIKKQRTRFLPCTILFHKDLFKAVDGFDEDFTGAHSGGYGAFDADFSKKMVQEGYYRYTITNVVATEYMEDVVGPNIQQKTGVVPDTHHYINKKIWYSKLDGKTPRNTKHLNFKWEKAFKYERW